MSSHHDDIVVPRGALLGAAAVILLSVGLAAAARHAHLAEPSRPLAPARDAIEVRFEDASDGSIRMMDASGARQLASVPPRSDGFVRGVLRGMFRTRKLESVGRQESFRLAREADGHLTLTDPRTGRRVELSSFGPDNAGAFARLLDEGVAASSGSAK